jgi:hypothetical protein
MINNYPNIVPENKILIVPENNAHRNDAFEIVESLQGNSTREWINDHVRHCLPVVIGNQYGFAIKSCNTFTAVWNGGSTPLDVNVEINNKNSNTNLQKVTSHFGSGLITIQNRFTFRTPPNINLLILDPPNYFIPSLSNMFAVVETDNLRRDFTFNLKITEPNKEVKVNKGDYISAIIPIPRFFVDRFEIDLAENYFDSTIIEQEQQEMRNAGRERSTVDQTKPHAVGKRYWRGQDTQGNQFSNHQRRIQKKS